MSTTRLLTILLALGLGCGCTANPQPVPLPINTDAVYLSGASSDGSAVLAGQPGAVSEVSTGMEVVVEGTQRKIQTRATVGPDGSFIVQVVRSGNELLEMWVTLDKQAGPPVEVKTVDILPPTPPVLDIAVQTVGPVVSGQVEIAGTATGDLVLVGNPMRSVSQSARPDSQSRWTVTIAAQQGDELRAFVVEEGFRVATEPIRVPVN